MSCTQQSTQKGLSLERFAQRCLDQIPDAGEPGQGVLLQKEGILSHQIACCPTQHPHLPLIPFQL